MNLQRFITAQNGKRGNYTLYELALKEIKEGKPSFECWIRYIYPQLKRKNTSKLTNFYGLDSREEAIEYINNPILKERLIKAVRILIDSDKSIYSVFSSLGVLKIRSCMLLFSSISDELVFKQLIRKYHW
jgi:uncharacterized protein (DUF1810 family)